MYVGQTEVSTGVTVRQSCVIEPETMQDRRMEVMDVDFVLGDVYAEFVR